MYSVDLNAVLLPAYAHFSFRTERVSFAKPLVKPKDDPLLPINFCTIKCLLQGERGPLRLRRLDGADQCLPGEDGTFDALGELMNAAEDLKFF